MKDRLRSMPSSGHRLLLERIVLSVATLLAGLSQSGAETLNYSVIEETFGEPVTVSATGTPQRAGDVPVDMEIITSDEIRRSGAVNVPDILSHFAGLDVRRNSLGSADVAIRGYNTGQSPRILVLVNGRQVYLDHYGFTDWNALPVQLTEIKQIELVRGPNSALFGFNAASGVINIVTVNPLYDDVTIGEARIGTQSYNEASGVATLQKNGDYGLRLSTGGYTAHEFHSAYNSLDPLGNFGSTNYVYNEIPLATNPRNGRVNADFRQKLTPDIEAGLEASATTDSDLTLNPFGYYNRGQTRTNSFKGYMMADTDLGQVTATAYSNFLQSYSELPYNGLSAGLSVLPIKQRVTVVQTSDQFRVGMDHTVRVSGEYRHNSVNTVPIQGADVNYDVYAASGMWNWQISETLAWTNAARVDVLTLGRSGPLLGNLGLTNADFNRTLNAETWNSGLVWWASDTDRLLLSAARGTQLPSLYDFGGIYAAYTVSGVLIVQSGIPTVKPAITDNYEAALTHQLKGIATELKAALFYQVTHDSLNAAPTRTFIYSTATSKLQTLFLNNGQSTASGMELSAKGKLAESWRWNANYSFIDIGYDPITTGNPTVVGRSGLAANFATGTPTNKVNMGIGYAKHGWETDLTVRYNSPFTGQRATGNGLGYLTKTIPDTVDMGGRIAYSPFSFLTLAVSAQQINSYRQTTIYGLPTERQAFFTITGRY